MPKGQGDTGDKVLVRVIRNDKDRRKTQDLIDKVAFIDKHEHLITNDKNYHILQLLKQGESFSRVEVLMMMSRRNVYNRLNDVVNIYMKQQ
ncbi:hypothetical protein MTQ87_11590, partial [Staphylococcus hyicus]